MLHYKVNIDEPIKMPSPRPPPKPSYSSQEVRVPSSNQKRSFVPSDLSIEEATGYVEGNVAANAYALTSTMFAVAFLGVKQTKTNLQFDNGSDPHDVMSEGALLRYLKDHPSAKIVTLPSPKHSMVFGRVLTISEEIEIVTCIKGAGSHDLHFKTNYRICRDHKGDSILLGSITMHSLGLINIPEALARVSTKLAGQLVDLTSLDKSKIFKDARLGKPVDLPSISTNMEASSDYIGPNPKLPNLSMHTLHSWNELDCPSESIESEDVHIFTPFSDFERSLSDGPDGPDLGVVHEGELKFKLNEMLQIGVDSCKKTHLPTWDADLTKLVNEFSGIFRHKLDGAPACKLDPFKVELIDPSTKPYKCALRSYSRAKSEFIDEWTSQLIEFGLGHVEKASEWAFASMAVPKPPNKLRFVTDYTPGNKCFKQYAWPMPRVHEHFDKLSGSKYFMKVDLDNAYWQIDLEETSRKILSIMTPNYVISPHRMPMGIHNAVMHLQSQMTLLLKERLNNILIWLDDILIHGKTWVEFMENVRFFFEKCKSVGLFLNPAKTTLFAEEVEWCGRVISHRGIHFHPRQLKPLLEMGVPCTAGDLQQLVCGSNWFRSAIPDYAKLVSPLQDFLTLCTRKINSSKKKQLDLIKLEFMGWSDMETIAVLHLKQAIQNSMWLAHPDPKATMCVFTDASSTHWGVVVTQVVNWDNDKDVIDQEHEPLSMLSGAFKLADLNAPIVEKEAFAINEAVNKLGYLLEQPAGFKLFTDHRNLVFMLDPFSVTNKARRNSVDKISRWALSLFSLNFSIHHITGDDNMWADLLTRWGAASSTVMPSEMIHSMSPCCKDLDDCVCESSSTIHSRTEIPHRKKYNSFHNVSYSVTDDNFVWPSDDAIKASQQRYASDECLLGGAFASQRTIVDGIVLLNGKKYIPAADIDLQIRFCIIAHTGAAGHTNMQVGLKYLKDNVTWINIDKDFTKFYKSCLQCAVHNPDLEMKRPWGESIIATKPNEVIEFDFLFMEKAHRDALHKYEYVLVLKDKFSKFVWLHPCIVANADAVVDALLQWCTLFGVPKIWISDQGTHFKNEVMTELNRRLGSNHHFTTAYCPWSNGSVERVNRTLLAVVRKILSEKHWHSADWVWTIPSINKLMNETPSRTLGNRSPREVFINFKPEDPVHAVLFRPGVEKLKDRLQPVDFSSKEYQKYREDLDLALTDFHSKVALTQEQINAYNKSIRDKQHNVILCQFEVGCFVLKARVTSLSKKKLKARWTGPFRVTKVINKWVYEIEDLLLGTTSICHAARLKFYSDSSLNVDNVLLDQITYDRGDVTFGAFHSSRVNPENFKIELCTSWQGFDESENTWEDIDYCYSVDPVKVKQFVNSLKDLVVANQLRSALGLPVKNK